MRVIIRTVILIFVFGLQSVCLGAKADKSNVDIVESIEQYVATAQKQAQDQVDEALAEAKVEIAAAKEDMEAIDWEFDGAEGKWRTNVPPVTPSVKLNRAISIITDKFGPDSAENVLVIPAVDMDAQKLAETVEDMKIMSHIFAKELAEADMLPGGRRWVFFWRRSSNELRCIYLEGYGAVFLMEVDFPLLPVAEPQAQEAEEGTDPVWQEARRQLTSPEEDIFDSGSDEEVEYDADKVEDLKSKLIRNLKHASNIRNLPDKEWIIIAVTGAGGQTGGIQIDVHVEGDKGGRSGRGRPGAIGGRARALSGRGSRAGGGRAGAVGGRGGGFGGGFTGGLSTTPASATVLTVRAKKADVDAFAKGKLDFDKFQKRVQMFTY